MIDVDRPPPRLGGNILKSIFVYSLALSLKNENGFNSSSNLREDPRGDGKNIKTYAGNLGHLTMSHRFF